ncbi:MAG: amidohydrolase, partial [Oscillospiraceae bacterium]
MTLLEQGKQYEDYIISMRRYFHENPEKSGEEIQTVKRICEELDKIGVDYVEIKDGGILAKIVGDSSCDRSVLLRADVDGLPVQETEDNLIPGGRTCKSKNDGLMHACGHDGHIAMLLGAAKILKDKQSEIKGTVYLCFERGEEGAGNVRYIFAYIDKNNIKIDSCYGIHLLSTLETGKIGINDTNMMAGAMIFYLEIQGRGGHGSRPDQSMNPINAFVAIYQGLQALRLTKIDPYKTLTYSVGALNSGVVANVIPQSLSFGGTMRTFDRDGAGMTFYSELKNLIDNSCKAYDCVP